MEKKYVVRLSGRDQRWLESVARRGRNATREITRVRILLKSDVN